MARDSLWAVVVLLSCGEARASVTERVPTAVQRAVAGCWSLSAHERVVFERTATGLRAVQHGGLGGVRTLRSVVRYDAATGDLGFRAIGRIHAARVVMHPNGATLTLTYFSRREARGPWHATGTATATRCGR